MKQTPNAERPTPNVEFRHDALSFGVRRSALDVRRLLWRLLEIAIAALFIYAGALKVLDPIGFANDIDHYHLLPWPVAAALAFYLPWIEICCGIALIIRRDASGALAVLIALMIVFITATIAAKARGIDVSCGCFGHVARGMSFTSHLAIDLAIFAALLLVWRHTSKVTRPMIE